MRLRYLFFILVFGFIFYSCSTTNSGRMIRQAHSNATMSTAGNSNQTGNISQPMVHASESTSAITTVSSRNMKILTRNLAKVIHFNFNSYRIKTTIDKYGIDEHPIAMLNKIVVFLEKYPNIYVKIEGNCDDRGTQEYNLALGQKRAEAAKNYLTYSGISGRRVLTVSYGEDRPVALGNNQIAWAKNRRDNFVFYTKSH